MSQRGERPANLGDHGGVKLPVTALKPTPSDTDSLVPSVPGLPLASSRSTSGLVKRPVTALFLISSSLTMQSAGAMSKRPRTVSVPPSQPQSGAVPPVHSSRSPWTKATTDGMICALMSSTVMAPPSLPPDRPSAATSISARAPMSVRARAWPASAISIVTSPGPPEKLPPSFSPMMTASSGDASSMPKLPLPSRWRPHTVSASSAHGAGSGSAPR